MRRKLHVTVVALAIIGDAWLAQSLAAGRLGSLTVHATGEQIYECRSTGAGSLAWGFREPRATLFENGKVVGRHFAGPTWQMADGSAVVGKVKTQMPGTTKKDIPLLKLEVANRYGHGELDTATTVERLNTRGGVFSGSCMTPGAVHGEPYSADYVFSIAP